jgi:predicted GNAT family acetyltransferase
VQASLDRAAWTALTTRQAHLGHGNELVRRYHPDVAPFAGLSDESPAAYEALGALVQPGGYALVPTLQPLVEAGVLKASPLGMIHQMIATQHGPERADELQANPLGVSDVDDMLALVRRTRPGPFARRTLEMGHYIGIRDKGRLVAMAGERMNMDGFVEISAVCVDDEWRGKGIAGRLMTALRTQIEARGDTAFLHVLSENKNAIALYERLGFSVRRTFFLTRLEHPDQDAAQRR